MNLDRHVTLIQCSVIEAELDLRHIIGRESHLDQSHAQYLSQSYTEGPSRFPWADTAINSTGRICLLVMYRIFVCITHYSLLLRRPGAGYITNAGYTLLNFFIIIVKCLLMSRQLRCFFYFTALGHVRTSGGWPLHTCPTLKVSRHSVIQTLHQWRCDILLPLAALNLWIIHYHFWPCGTSGGWPLHTCPTLTLSRYSVIQTLYQWRCACTQVTVYSP